MEFVVGLVVGSAIAYAGMWATWRSLRRDGGTLVNMWWAENAERWEWLREQLLAERDSGAGGAFGPLPVHKVKETA